MRRLQNKVAIVTGSRAGIDEAIAMRFAQEGARVVVCELSRTHGESAVDAIRKVGGEVMFVETTGTFPILDAEIAAPMADISLIPRD